MNKNEVSKEIKAKAGQILEVIKSSKSILLHCHPSPDPDSVGSVLAMKFVLEGMGKKATVIKGDSIFPEAYKCLPGSDTILAKNFFEININDYDLFIVVDTASPEMISRIGKINFPLPIRSIVIDHHGTNTGFGDINLIEPNYPAAGQVLYELFLLWDINMSENIAKNLFAAIYTDTGGFKYPYTTYKTYAIGAELTKIAPSFSRLISDIENSNTPNVLVFESLAIGNIKTFLNGHLAISVISYKELQDKNILPENVRSDVVTPMLRSVKDWYVTGLLVEIEPGNVRLNLRSHNGEIYDVSKLAKELGGGGHKEAAGVRFSGSLDDALKLIVSKAEGMYNL